jgi:hypothetical protein
LIENRFKNCLPMVRLSGKTPPTSPWNSRSGEHPRLLKNLPPDGPPQSGEDLASDTDYKLPGGISRLLLTQKGITEKPS